MMGNLYYELEVHRRVSDNLQLIKPYTFSVSSKKRCTLTLVIYYSDTGQVWYSDP